MNVLLGFRQNNGITKVSMIKLQSITHKISDEVKNEKNNVSS